MVGRSRSVLRLHRSSATSLTRGLARYPTAANAPDCMGEDTDGPMIRILFAVSPTHNCGTELARITFACLSDPSQSQNDPQQLHQSAMSIFVRQHVAAIYLCSPQNLLQRAAELPVKCSKTEVHNNIRKAQSAMSRCIAIPVRRKLHLTGIDH